jgi:LPS sulfotransferase NodH
MFKINKTPILILATPRTGSSVLGAYIKSVFKKDIPYFQEPDYSGQEEINEFRNYFNHSKDFILKCHFIHLDRYGTDISDYLLREAYKIRIRRKDFVKQVASLYIAEERNNYWHFRNTEQLNLVDTVLIDTAKIKQSISYLKYANYRLDCAPVNFDLDLYYEDLPIINDAGYYIVPKPSNYNELLDIIKKFVKVVEPL